MNEESVVHSASRSSPGFSNLGLNDLLIKALEELGYEEPTPIQRQSIPPVLEGRDVVGQAATGTGKTAAFALPILQKLYDQGSRRAQPSALVLVPTRELAMQVAEAVHRYGRALNASVAAIYGGQAFGPQFRALERGVDVIVATPGRALDHIRRESLKLGNISVVVLDEADEMLDMGFAEDLEAILAQTPAETRQTVLFSATMPPRIAGIAKRHLRDPVRIQIAKEPTAKGATPKVRQIAYLVQRGYKMPALGRVLDVENPEAALVFCRTRIEVDDLTEKLTARGYRAHPLHGGISQDQRSRVVQKLRNGDADLVIATDVAARGLDIEALTHVVNYDVPDNPESYVHRIGRVGRAGREGVAITLVEPRESRLLKQFEQAARHKIEMGQVPTIADLRAKQFDLTRASLQELLLAGKLDQFRVIVETLAQEFDLMDIALAAAKLAHQAIAGDAADQEQEIPAIELRPSKGGPGRSEQDGASRKTYRDRGKTSDRNHPRPAGQGMTRLFIGAGRAAGIRPQDLVGAIANEAGISGRQIGAIDIADKFSLVEVPDHLAAQVLQAMRKAQIKGHRIPVRKDNRER